MFLSNMCTKGFRAPFLLGRMVQCSKYILSSTHSRSDSSSRVSRLTLTVKNRVGGNFHLFIKRTFKIGPDEKRQKFKPKHYWDKVPPEFTLIYESELKYWILCLKATTLLSAVLVGAIGLYYPDINRAVSQEDQLLAATVLGAWMACILVFNMISRQFVLRIYHNNGHFIAVRRTYLGRLKQWRYTIDDVSCTHKPGTEIHESAVVKIKNSKCHLTARNFVSPVFYNLHVGDKFAGNTTYDMPKF
ncbi:unnamed protein product [Lymnaea stagnalis]|uniref:Transmembrane protein 186 n=1 Tax=Lymnaea stagnalis TaxID=6523 RepID=A0AAV2IDL5_LYMST